MPAVGWGGGKPPNQAGSTKGGGWHVLGWWVKELRGVWENGVVGENKTLFAGRLTSVIRLFDSRETEKHGAEIWGPPVDKMPKQGALHKDWRCFQTECFICPYHQMRMLLKAIPDDIVQHSWSIYLASVLTPPWMKPGETYLYNGNQVVLLLLKSSSWHHCTSEPQKKFLCSWSIKKVHKFPEVSLKNAKMHSFPPPPRCFAENMHVG